MASRSSFYAEIYICTYMCTFDKYAMCLPNLFADGAARTNSTCNILQPVALVMCGYTRMCVYTYILESQICIFPFKLLTDVYLLTCTSYIFCMHCNISLRHFISLSKCFVQAYMYLYMYTYLSTLLYSLSQFYSQTAASAHNFIFLYETALT